MLTLAPLDTPRSQVGEAMDKDKSFWDHGTWKEEDEADEDYEPRHNYSDKNELRAWRTRGLKSTKSKSA